MRVTATPAPASAPARPTTAVASGVRRVASATRAVSERSTSGSTRPLEKSSATGRRWSRSVPPRPTSLDGPEVGMEDRLATMVFPSVQAELVATGPRPDAGSGPSSPPYRPVRAGAAAPDEPPPRPDIRRRRLRGRRSVQLSSMLSRQCCRVPVTGVSNQPSALRRPYGHTEYCCSWLTTTLNRPVAAGPGRPRFPDRRPGRCSGRLHGGFPGACSGRLPAGSGVERAFLCDRCVVTQEVLLPFPVVRVAVGAQQGR